MKRFHSKHCPKGFSLIEVLFAVAVITVIMVLLLPALGRARESANAAACTQNLRRIGVGLTQYMGENNGNLIPYASLGGSPQKFWFDELDKYMDEEPYQFDRERPHKWQLCPSKPVAPEGRSVVGYGWNHRYLGYTSSDPKGGKANIRQISRPSETIVIGDSRDIIDRNSPPAQSEHRYLYSQSAPMLAARHSGKGFYLLLDGHVMSASPEEVVDTGTGPYRLWWRKPR